MRKLLPPLLALLCPAPLLAAEADPEPQAFVKLFNGRDLKGWKVFPNGAGRWEVKDGLLVCSGPISHLFSERGDYRNFHLRVEAKINERGNSGVYFRTTFARTNYPTGWEAQIALDGVKTGSLYPNAITQRLKGLVVPKPTHRADEWFLLEVICKGGHIVIKVDGKETVNWEDRANTFKQGHLALQHHNPGTQVRFRKIELKRLPDAE